MTTVIADIRCRAQTSLRGIAYRISRTLFIGSTRYNGNTTHSRIWIGYRSFGAAAFEGTSFVVAKSSGAAAIWFRTFVDVDALNVGIASESGGTLTRVTAWFVRADCIQAASSSWSVHGITFVDINTASCNVTWIVGPSLLTNAIGFSSFGFAVGMWAAFNILTWSFAGHAWRSSNETAENETKSIRNPDN